MEPRIRPDGFLERGADVTRLEAFVDAAFAFALTMLVISVGAVPRTMPDMVAALKGTPAFAASFAQIAWFWYAHVTWSRRYGLDDGPSTVLSLVLVFLVMVFVYPLKAVFATLFGWVTRGALPYGFDLRTPADITGMFVTYGIVFATMSALLALLYLHAWRQRAALALSTDEAIGTITTAVGWLVSVGVAMASMLAALSIRPDWPNWALGMPGMAYCLLFLSGPIPAAVGRRLRSQQNRQTKP